MPIGDKIDNALQGHCFEALKNLTIYIVNVENRGKLNPNDIYIYHILTQDMFIFCMCHKFEMQQGISPWGVIT